MLRFALYPLEGNEGFDKGSIGVGEAAPIVVGVFIFGRGVLIGLPVVGVAQREVGRVVGHGILAAHIEHHSRKAETLDGRPLNRGPVYRVALGFAARILQGIFEQNILVERVVLGRGALLGERVEQRGFEFDLLGQETTQFDHRGDIVLVVVVEPALGQTLVDTTETHGLDMAGHIERGNVGEAQIQIGLGGPTARLVKVGEPHLVHPNRDGLGGVGVVAHTNHHRAYIAQRGITHNGYLVLGLLGVIDGVAGLIGHTRIVLPLLGIALQLQVGEDRQREIEHVGRRPHSLLALCIVGVVIARLGQRKGYLVLIVIGFAVGAQPQEHRHVAVAQVGIVVDELLGMDKHLQPLVGAHVHTAVFIDGTSLAGRQVGHLQRHGLLVELGNLRLSRVDDTGHSRRQYIVYRLLSGILLDIDYRDV